MTFSAVHHFASEESQMMGLSIIPKMTNWFKNLSKLHKTLLIAIMALLIFCSPWLYQRVLSLYNGKLCAMNGGKWTRVGMAETPFCIYTYPDGGTPCYSSEECTGGCAVYNPPIQGQPTPSVGICRFNNNPFACEAPIEHPETYACSD